MKYFRNGAVTVRESMVADLDAFYDIYKDPNVGRFMHDLSPENVASRGLLAGLGFVPCGVHAEKGRHYIQYIKKGTR